MNVSGIPPATCRVPRATYRLQFNRHFTFEQATDIVEYLRDLGISDLYASPLFQAGPQSTHGYDVCGFNELSSNLGAPDEFDRLAARLKQLGMGLLLDMVPNHMGADLTNAWWLDVLEKGEASQYARWFDIDWEPLSSEIRGQVLLPTLEDHYAKVLQDGKLRVVFEEGALALAYHDRKFPLSPDSIGMLLDQAGSSSRCGPAARSALGRLRASLAVSKEHSLAATRANGQFRAQLRASYETVPEFRGCLDLTLKQVNGPKPSREFNFLHKLIRRQHYRLAFWRVGPEEINYRRFFDVTELVSLRMEVPEVFASTHQLVFELLRAGKITGLRIDHPDGLWDPKQYFSRLQHGYRDHRTEKQSLYIVAEKILIGDEPLPEDWPIAGTTGYDFLNRVNGLFVQPRSLSAFGSLYSEFIGSNLDFPTLIYSSKKRILRTSLISELNGLASRLKKIAVATLLGQDLTLHQLHSALTEIIASFPVYRTYNAEASSHATASDREYIQMAVKNASARNPHMDPVALEFIRRLLLLEFPEDLDAPVEKQAREFVMRFQQLTGPVMAKGVEDTAFYNFNRLISLNEVGGDPDAFGTTPNSFHEWNQQRIERWPHSLLATATHDTKRGEDVRARLNVLSEMPEQWRTAVCRWRELNAPRKSVVEGEPAPHSNDEYLFYQTLVGAWTPAANTPVGLSALRRRLSAYMEKAIKEAKSRTTWTIPNSAYEEATRSFVEAVLDSDANEPFLREVDKFQTTVAVFGLFNSLSQLLLKLTCPGVPDFYQGTELWDFNLVDPDNRRPVNFEQRRRMLEKIKAGSASDKQPLAQQLSRMLECAETGEIKLYLVWRTLHLRLANQALFDTGGYMPLQVHGAKAEHVCAFARTWRDKSVIVVVPRLVFGLMAGRARPPLGPEVWQDTKLVLPRPFPDPRFRNVLTGELVVAAANSKQLPVADVLSALPVALLENH